MRSSSRLARLAGAALLCLALAPAAAVAQAAPANAGAPKPAPAKAGAKATARGPIRWIADDWPRALAEARRRDALVVVDTWAPW